jgi:hypothetical protein
LPGGTNGSEPEWPGVEAEPPFANPLVWPGAAPVCPGAAALRAAPLGFFGGAEALAPAGASLWPGALPLRPGALTLPSGAFAAL